MLSQMSLMRHYKTTLLFPALYIVIASYLKRGTWAEVLHLYNNMYHELETFYFYFDMGCQEKRRSVGSLFQSFKNPKDYIVSKPG